LTNRNKNHKKSSVKIIDFYNVLGGINRRWKARIDWRNYINGFDLSAVSKGKGKLEKISFREIFELTPATVAQRKYLRYFLESVLLSSTTDIPPCDIHGKSVQIGSLLLM